MTIKILGIVGARPNFMKIDPVFRVLEQEPEKFSTRLVHTGQHYDDKMSKVFFHDLGLRPPDIDLEVGSGSHTLQIGTVMLKIEPVLMQEKPDLVIVVGDVNSTLAGALTAVKLNIPVAHVEAGLRSFDRTMPEEINRIVTDTLSRYLFTPSADGNDNLRREGIQEERIFLVGNVMIDTLQRCRAAAEKTPILEMLDLQEEQYALLTLHRPSNVDDPQVLAEILEALEEIQQAITIVFPMHPRTGNRIRQFDLSPKIAAMPNLRLIPPLGYLEFLKLQVHAKFIMTDSGGIQEEATILRVPCLTLRLNTERPITLTHGTNQLVGYDKVCLVAAAQGLLNGGRQPDLVPEWWDGRASERIVEVLRNL